MALREAAGLFQPVPKRRVSQLFFKGELRGEATSRTQNPPSWQRNDTARNAGWHRASSMIIARPVTAPHGPETYQKRACSASVQRSVGQPWLQEYMAGQFKKMPNVPVMRSPMSRAFR